MNHDEIEKEELRRWQTEQTISAFERRSGFGTNFDPYDIKTDSPIKGIKKKSEPTWSFKKVHYYDHVKILAELKCDAMFFIRKIKPVRSEYLLAVIVTPVGASKLSDTKFSTGCKQLEKHQQVSKEDFIKAIVDNFEKRFER